MSSSNQQSQSSPHVRLRSVLSRRASDFLMTHKYLLFFFRFFFLFVLRRMNCAGSIHSGKAMNAARGGREMKNHTFHAALIAYFNGRTATASVGLLVLISRDPGSTPVKYLLIKVPKRLSLSRDYLCSRANDTIKSPREQKMKQSERDREITKENWQRNKWEICWTLWLLLALLRLRLRIKRVVKSWWRHSSFERSAQWRILCSSSEFVWTLICHLRSGALVERKKNETMPRNEKYNRMFAFLLNCDKCV